VDLWTAPAALGNDDGSATVKYLPARDYLRPTALPGACSVAPSAKPRLGALLSSDDFGSRVERKARGQVLWPVRMKVAEGKESRESWMVVGLKGARGLASSCEQIARLKIIGVNSCEVSVGPGCTEAGARGHCCGHEQISVPTGEDPPGRSS
jgi:hypothetical protein